MKDSISRLHAYLATLRLVTKASWLLESDDLSFAWIDMSIECESLQSADPAVVSQWRRLWGKYGSKKSEDALKVAARFLSDRLALSTEPAACAFLTYVTLTVEEQRGGWSEWLKSLEMSVPSEKLEAMDQSQG